MSALAGQYRIIIDQGATYSQVITWEDSIAAAYPDGLGTPCDPPPEPPLP